MVEECIPTIVSSSHIVKLIKLSDVAEIKNCVFTMNPEGAAGPDGFSGLFYTSCWDIINADLVAAIHEFFRRHALPKS